MRMEAAVLGLFAAGLIACVAADWSMLIALAWGLALFVFYALREGFTAGQVGRMLMDGVKKIRNILLVFLCIGCLTGIWRLCGTIPYIVYHTAGWIVPRYFVLCAFLLCAGISFITGSSFSTASTVGAICMMLGNASGVAPAALAGAILAGCFFGDRCSPMSSSALLVASVTHTSIYDNLKTMFRTAAVPLLISCTVFLLMGTDAQAASGDVLSVFEHSFTLCWPLVLPAVLTLVLCILRVEIKRTMLLSTLCGIVLCVVVQHVPLAEIFRTLLLGFQPKDPQLSALLSGGGIRSMVNVSLIVMISSSFSGIFEKTRLLSGVSERLCRFCARTTRETAAVLAAAVSCMIACNQTLAVLLSDQLLRSIAPDDHERASWLEDTAIVIAPLFPWNIAGSVPLAILGAGIQSLPYACYLYLIPLWLIIRGIRRKEKPAC